jgi:hypothetical protein
VETLRQALDPAESLISDHLSPSIQRVAIQAMYEDETYGVISIFRFSLPLMNCLLDDIIGRLSEHSQSLPPKVVRHLRDQRFDV